MSSLLLTTTHAAVTTVTLNRPDKRNALNVPLLTELGEALRVAEADAAQRVLVLRGAGPVFCSGLDLTEAAADPEVAGSSAALIGQTLQRLASTRLVTIAAVQGAALAGGAGLMSACDFVVAVQGTTFGYPEVRRGLVPALIMTFLRRQLRERDARELLLLGKPFNADHAQAIGLINGVAPDERALEVEVQVIIDAILRGAPEAVAETKELLRSLWPAKLTSDLEAAQAYHLEARGSPEAKEGIAAFQEKRPPAWAPRG